MPITTPESIFEQYGDKEHFKHVFDHLFVPALNVGGYGITPPSASGSDLIQAEIIKNLETSDLVLCDISTFNPNVFFELGIRTALDRPVALVMDNYTPKIPFDTSSINTHTYNASLMPWSLETEIPKLARHIADVASREGGRNPLWRYFGLTQRAAPAEIADPTEAKLQLVIEGLTQLTKQVSSLKADNTYANSTFTFPADMSTYTGGPIYSTPLSNSTPQKFDEFIKRAAAIAARESASLEVQGYDEMRERIVLNTGNWPLSISSQKEIDRLAGRLKVNFTLVTPKPLGT